MGLFREYVLRGIVGKELTESIAEQFGRAYCTYVKDRGVQTISVGRDGRLSSPGLFDALVKGLMAGGMHVIDVGICPSPLVYFSLFQLPVDGGIMITGSHNASEYNGFKVCVGKEAIHGEAIQELRRVMESGEFTSGRGARSEHPIIPDYLAYLKKSFSGVDAKHLHVVIDCGNGAASLVAKDALELLGCRVTGLYCELDGRFPNHHPDPTVVENLDDLVKAVAHHKADVGIGYDGDGDRIGAIDEQGQILWGDRLMVVYSRDILSTKPGSTIISEVKASQCLYDDIAKQGGRAIMWKTGHSFIKRKIKEMNASLAGEMSGHFFFKDRWFGFDDALYAGGRLLEILSQENETSDSIFSQIPNSINTPELKISVTESEKFSLMQSLLERANFSDASISTIDGLRINFKDGWGLVRPSNTTPYLIMRFEAINQSILENIQSIFRHWILSVKPDLILPF